MNKYNPEELNIAIKEAISKGIKDEGMLIASCSYLVMNKIQMVI